MFVSTFGLPVLLITIAALSHAQESLTRVDGFSFPGETARSPKFPVENSDLSLIQQTPKPNRPSNPLEPVNPILNIPPSDDINQFEPEVEPVGVEYDFEPANPTEAEGRGQRPRPTRRRPKPRPSGWNNNIGRTTKASVTRATTASPEFQMCLNECRITAEWNPLCGTDDRTYNNPGQLNCAQYCGKSVQRKSSGACPPPTTAATVTTARNQRG